jgi:hypothetical protein
MLARSIDRSLQRLQTDHLDLLQLHTCTEEVLRAGGVIEVIQAAKAAGKTRAIGYSGDSATARFALEMEVFDTLQTSVNLADQESIDLTLPLAKAQGVGVIAKRPVANVAWAKGDGPGYHQTYYQRLLALNYPGLSVEMALRFTLAQDVATLIVGTSKPHRWLENAEIAARGPLPTAEVEAIRARWREVAPVDWVGQE